MAYGALQARIDGKLGLVGRKIGQPFTVYRCGTTGDFPNDWTNLGSVNAFHHRTTLAKNEVSVERGDMLYNLYVDAGKYLLGDIFVCTDPPMSAGVSYGAGATILPSTLQINAFTLASHMPARIPLACRIDRRCQVLRPSEAPATLGDGSAYWQETAENDQPLVLSGGSYAFASPGAGRGSWVPVGLQSVTRRSDYPFQKEPGIVRTIAWLIYLPPLPGYEMSPGDAIITEDGARFIILGSYNQEVGVVGTQAVADQKITGSPTVERAMWVDVNSSATITTPGGYVGKTSGITLTLAVSARAGPVMLKALAVPITIVDVSGATFDSSQSSVVMTELDEAITLTWSDGDSSWLITG